MNRFIGDGKYQLNSEDIKKWAWNVVIFTAPALLIGLVSFQQNWDWKAGLVAFSIAFYGLIVDLVRKFVRDNTK